MFKVECPGCSAPYQVDERRVPSSGLKMRCPKCGTSFKVSPPEGAQRPAQAPETPGKPSALERPARGVAGKSTMVGVPPPSGSLAPQRALSGAYDEVDLPTVGPRPSARGATLPEPEPARFESDLPAPLRPAARPPPSPPAIDDLPAPAPPRPAPPLERRQRPADRPPLAPPPIALDPGEADLPAALGTLKAQPAYGEEADLPGLVGSEPPPGQLSLQGEISDSLLPDLPSPNLGASPSRFGEVDLPAAYASPERRRRVETPGEADLPAAFGVVGLPAPSADLPSPAASLPSPAASLPSPAAGLPAYSTTTPGLPSLGAGSLPAPARAGAPAAQGEVPLRVIEGGEGFGELELPVAKPPSMRGPAQLGIAGDAFEAPVSAPRPSEALVRQAGGGTSYGEVNLDGPEGASAGGPLSDDMEFGAIPQEPSKSTAPAAPPPPPPATASISAPAAAAAVAPRPARPRPAPKTRRTPRVIAALAALLALGGGALALVPSVGPFGAYWIMDQVKGGEYQQLTATTAERARQYFAKDSYPEAKQGLELLDRARAEAKRVEALAAYTAYAAYLSELRFGPQPEMHARAQVLLSELTEAPPSTELDLARAAQAVVSGQLPSARSQLQSVIARSPKSVDALVLQGELELEAKDGPAALRAWSGAASLERSPRTAFGLARAKRATGDASGAREAAKSALAQNSAHVGARILLAELELETNEAEGVRLLQEITAEPGKASPEELVHAQTLLADQHLQRSHVSRAEAAYNEALKVNPKSAPALSGLGEALFRAGRYSEALARFEAATHADPENLSVKIGVAKSKLRLERPQEASAILKQLREQHPKLMQAAYWLGKVKEALGDRKGAEAEYRTAIQLGGRSAEVADPYIALSQLLAQQGRDADAQKVLNEARAALANSSRLHLGLGELALSQGRPGEAIERFRAALKAEPGDLGIKYRLAVALRRNRSYDDAGRLFDEIAAVDADYPGLALERGLLHEASGRGEEALRAYEAALAKAPNDPDLMLRVGCGKLASGGAEQAIELLRKVQTLRPNLAESNHCLGRAMLMQGHNLPDALRMLERATELDPNRAEYWLYVGWAANEASRVAKAEAALGRALELDQSLADAYWQRGVLRGRGGAVKDAVRDLVRALELKPGRYEAHAALADAYDQLGHEAQALSEWQRATAAEPSNALWRFRYGRLLAVAGRADAAREHLSRALELVKDQPVRPAWQPEAHLHLARVLGARGEAVKHWQAYLQTGPRESVYRKEAKAALEQLGSPWAGE